MRNIPSHVTLFQPFDLGFVCQVTRTLDFFSSLPIHAVVVLFAIVAAELSGAGVLWETSQQQQTATPQHS